MAKKKRTTRHRRAVLPPPALPPRPVDALAQPAPPPAAIAELPPPPVDPMEAQAWAHRALMLTLRDAALDEKLSPRERRKELRAIAYAAGRLMPSARLRQAEQLILEDRAELESTARDRRGAKLEDLDDEDGEESTT
jgi:hypothetical protein